jgi:WbqC-like protein
VTKTVVIHQPDFLPHLGFFHRFLNADLYVVLDHVQFEQHGSRGWTHRDKIKTPQGARWLSVSVRKAPLSTPINAVELSDIDWRGQNLDLIRENYRAAAYFDEIFPEMERLYALPCTKLVEFTMASIDMLGRLLDVTIACITSSSLEPIGRKNELLVDILRKVGASRYLSGVGARKYFDSAPFERAGIEVIWQAFNPPVYPQLHGAFVPSLSGIDVLFNCGIEGSRKILRNC